jgi:hypothetical protein
MPFVLFCSLIIHPEEGKYNREVRFTVMIACGEFLLLSHAKISSLGGLHPRVKSI